MIDKLQAISARLRELDDMVANPALVRDQNRYREIMRERSRLAVIDEAFAEYRRVLSGLED
ncbi:MAG TPA: peptide chain release factor 1, partial [Rectinemataceae bacterium]|nr:peptide chain release factor 1 [Rectinemataceae bacterium]